MVKQEFVRNSQNELQSQLKESVRHIKRYTNFFEKRFKAEGLSTTREIIDQEINSQTMIGVDSTQFLFWKSPISSIWLGFCRAIAVEYKYEGDEIKNHPIRSDFISKDEIKIIATGIEVLKTFPNEFSKADYEILEYAQTHYQDKLNGILSIYRKGLELSLISDIARRKKKVLISINGLLDYDIKAFQYRINNILEFCERNDNIMVGINKNNDTHHFRSICPDIDYIQKLSKSEKCPFFVKSKNKKNEMNQFVFHGNSFFAKLHEGNSPVIQVDIRVGKPSQVFQILRAYSKYNNSIGYPYPLIEAHQACLAIGKIKRNLQTKFLKIGFETGFTCEELTEGLTLGIND